MKAYSIKLDGSVLNRGFWLYIIDIQSPKGQYLYVGRTGDSSSANASSPFSRIGQHLDLRPNAKGNALARNLRKAGIEPPECSMMIAIGPVFPEESDFTLHRPIRDRIAALEHGLAQHLRERGYQVLGSHSSAEQPNPDLLDKIIKVAEEQLQKKRID